MNQPILLRYENAKYIEYPDDIERLRSILEANGYTAEPQDIQLAWQEFSDSMCAGWMMLRNDDSTNLTTLLQFLRPVFA